MRGLYVECNELPLASDAPPDVTRPTPRLQRVYVDLDVDQRLTLNRVLDRLQVPAAKRQEVRNALVHFGADETGQRGWEGDLPDELVARPGRALRQGRVLGKRRSAPNNLKQLGIEPEALAQALKPVTAFEMIGEQKQLVLLGDPGSGKSTLTRRIAGLLASEAVDELEARDRDWRGGLGHAFDHWHTPIRITLSRWARRLSGQGDGVANDLIAECLHVLREAGNVGDDRLRTYLTDRLNAKPPKVVVLLDGLDEVTDQKRREKLLVFIRDFHETYPQAPLVITCRVRPYSEDAGYRLPLAALTLAPLSDDSVANFLERWHDELVSANLYEMEEAAQARRRLAEAIGDPERPDLRRLADSALQLTIMARVNYKQGLPGSRAMLYEMYVNELLYEWEKKKQGDKGTPTDLEKLLKEAGLAIDDLNRRIEQTGLRRTRPEGRPRQGRHPTAAATGRSGGALSGQTPGSGSERRLLGGPNGSVHRRPLRPAAGQGDGQALLLAHRTFQEYLAARWMASSEALQRIQNKIDDPNWREVVLLTFGHQIFKLEQPDRRAVGLARVDATAVDTEVRRRSTLLLGEAYVRLLEPIESGSRPTKKLPARSLLTCRICCDRPCSAPLRMAQPATKRPWLASAWTPVCCWPTWTHTRRLWTTSFDIPSAGWSIGRYPVTNREFRRFMDAGGYDRDMAWWSKAALKEISFIWGRGTAAPRYWDDSHFNHPTQPVVGVSLYEANAYCAWLTGKLQAQHKEVEVRLPRSRSGRRPPARRYPWANVFDPAFANTQESGLGQTTPVDMYPDGATPGGVWDLAGNVWEWTDTSHSCGAEAYELVGGAWYSGANGVGLAARTERPRFRYNNNGFRVLSSPSLVPGRSDFCVLVSEF